MSVPKIAAKVKPKTPVPPPKPVKIGGKEAKTITRVPKDFKVVDYIRNGTKVMLYAQHGMGKTTLAMLLRNPIFLPLDDGVGFMQHPVTGERIKAIGDITEYQDVLDVLKTDVFEPYDEIVIDTITEVQRWQIPWMLANVKKQGGGKAENLEDYGFHKGYRHWFETMEELLVSLTNWVRKGKRIILLAQSNAIKMSNEFGEDYKKVGPDLYHDDKFSIYNLVNQWCDYILRINHTDLVVNNKKATGGSRRAVYLHPTVQYEAKTRKDFNDYPCVTFENPQDDSIWRLLFNGN